MPTYSITIFGNSPAEIAPIARKAEALGFVGIWVGDHVAIPINSKSAPDSAAPGHNQLVSPTSPYQYDAWVMLGNLIGATNTISVSSGIMVLALRHPLVQARAALTAWETSGGRFQLGIGAGWNREEFAALGIDYSARGKRLDEILDILEKAFAGGPFEHHGNFYDFPEVQLSPVAHRIPVIMGGDSPGPIQRVAKRGDGWYNTGGASLSDCARIRDEIEALRREYGREERPFRYHIRIIGEALPQLFATYKSEGFDNFIIPWARVHSPNNPDQTLAGKLQSLERLAGQLEIRKPKVQGQVA